jgi:hypothetical protein
VKAADDLQGKIIAYLNLLGWFVRRTNTIHVRGRAMPKDQQGYGDVQGCSATGLYVNIEVKIGANKLSEEQRDRIEQISKRGGIAFAVKSWENFEKEMAPQWLRK